MRVLPTGRGFLAAALDNISRLVTLPDAQLDTVAPSLRDANGALINALEALGLWPEERN